MASRGPFEERMIIWDQKCVQLDKLNENLNLLIQLERKQDLFKLPLDVDGSATLGNSRHKTCSWVQSFVASYLWRFLTRVATGSVHGNNACFVMTVGRITSR